MSAAIETLVRQAASQWGEGAIGHWRLQMLEHGLGERSGRLRASMQHREEFDGGDLQVTMTFLTYGMLADWGVGRGRKLRRGGALNPDRRPIPWHSARWGIQRIILARVVQKRLLDAARQLFDYADAGDHTQQFTFSERRGG